MKIGVITFWQANDNYGQLLQAWALQQYLCAKGHEAFIIRYDFKNREIVQSRNLMRKMLKILLIYPIILHIKSKIEAKKNAKIALKLEGKNSLRNFEEFRKTNLAFSSKVYHSLKELQADSPIADMYIVGSDQVWSLSPTVKENEVFYLNFGSTVCKRISYAASFGKDRISKSEKMALKNNLKRFDAISVREKSGVKICEDIGYKAIHVIDPTLLIGSKYYSRWCAFKKYSSHYIYIYSLNIDSAKDIYYSEILNYSIENNFKIVVTPASGRTLGRELFGQEVIYDYATIEEWVSNIYNSDLVVTTSFHGIAFCLALHVPFVYVPLKGKGSSMNSRIIDLLKAVNLESRIQESSNEFEKIVYKKIDWSIVDLCLSNFRCSSSNFLDNELNHNRK